MGIDYNRSPTVYIELGRENIATNTTKVKSIDKRDPSIEINSFPKDKKVYKVTPGIRDGLLIFRC